MGAGTAAAAKTLLKALESKGAAKAAGSFAKGMKSMEETEKSGGFDKFQSGMGALQGFMSSFEPLMVPLQVLTATIGAGTSDATVKLMNTMLEQLEKPGVQNVITAFTNLINLLFEALGSIMGWIGDVIDFLGQTDNYQKGDPGSDWKTHGTYYMGGDTEPTNTPVYFDPNDPSTHYMG